MQIQASQTQTIAIAMAAIGYLTQLAYKMYIDVRNNKNGNSTACHYPSHGGGCAFASKDFSDLRSIELADKVGSRLAPALERQNDLLEKILDGVRDLRP